MKFKQVAGTAIVPLIARIVLALAFTTVGYNKLFTTKVLEVPADSVVATLAAPPAEAESETGPEAGSPAETDPADPDGTTDSAATGPRGRLVAFVQDADGSAAGAAIQDAVTEAAGAAREAVEDAVSGVIPPPPPAAEADPEVDAGAAGDAAADVADAADALGASEPPVEMVQVEVRALHSITLMCEDVGWPQPQWLAWVAAITEFLGGIFLLLGLLTRLSALGVASAMGVAFYLVSMRSFGIHTTDPFEFATNIPQYTTAVAQLALFALAFGLVLTGAGPVSADRFLFASDGVKEAAAAATAVPAPARVAPPAVAPAPLYAAPGSVPPGYPAGVQPPPGYAAHPGYPAPGAAPAAAWGAPPVDPAAAPVSPPVPEVPLDDGAPSASPNESPSAPDESDGAGPRPSASFGGEGRPL